MLAKDRELVPPLFRNRDSVYLTLLVFAVVLLLYGAMAVVERIRLLRNVGKVDSVNAGGQLPFSKITLVFAENGRGKTTLAAVLRSLGDGNPVYITERKRLTATHNPHIVVSIANGASCDSKMKRSPQRSPRQRFFTTHSSLKMCAPVSILNLVIDRTCMSSFLDRKA
ncbi:hypothetical protein ACM42_01730 [Bradyrhizobium sp. CCBAU 25338]|nr:hypothetical protein [Bradyrhizobium sp. CCBAU 45389]MDA9527191.1 hypothetical protein [Bradyrhizobium sp. CCBAU 25338]